MPFKEDYESKYRFIWRPVFNEEWLYDVGLQYIYTQSIGSINKIK